MEQRLRGSRKLVRWWSPDPHSPPRSRKNRGRVVGHCRICGRRVRSHESYHRSGLGLAHLWCERR